MRNLLILLGTPIDTVTMTEAMTRVEEFIAVGRTTGKAHQIATVNADFVVKSLHDSQLQHILQQADMATADGMPLVWGARLLGVPIQGRVTGVDMVSAMAERAAQRGYSIYFLGAAPGVAQQAADELCRRYPGLRVAGVAAPSAVQIAQGDPSIVAACREADPDILLVALGNPKQEKWIYSHAGELSVPVMMGVGGSFDFIAGITKRAPEWMQETGLEWLHRLVSEPRRLWKRYAVDLVGFGFFFLWQWWIMQQARHSGQHLPMPDLQTIQDTVVLNVHGRLDSSNQNSFAEMAHAKLTENPYLIINLANAEFLDSSALGTIVALANRARDGGGDVWLAAVPPAIARVLALLRLDQFFQICDDVESALTRRRASTSVSAPPRMAVLEALAQS